MQRHVSGLVDLCYGDGPTGLLSVGALRTGVLPRWVALTLLFAGVTTILVLFGTPLPVGRDWATDHLAFLLSGLAYMIAGARLWGAERS